MLTEPEPECAEISATDDAVGTRIGTGIAVTALALGLSACGGSDGGTSGGLPTPTPTPTPAIVITDAEAARFLLQAQFAALDSDISAVKTQGYSAWLTNQLGLAASQGGWDWLTSQGIDIAHSSKGNELFFSSEIDPMVWYQLYIGADQMRKRCAIALSEMMVVSVEPAIAGKTWPQYLIAGYWDVLTANVFGNFRTLLEEVTLNPAMGIYLNTAGNLKEDASSGRQPDENYAREVMQLFTIGLYKLNVDGTRQVDASGKPIPTYAQSDVSNLARAFTGYDIDYSKTKQVPVSYLTFTITTNEFTRGRMAFAASDHSTLAATFLGTTIPANTDGATALKTALDTLFNHPNVGPFFGKQMIQKLVTSNPSAAYVGRVAAVFNDNGAGVRGDLKAVWKAILTDTEARTLPTSSTAGKVREPAMRFVQWGRTFSISSISGNWKIYSQADAATLGQSWFRAPSVFNFFRPEYAPPNTAIASSGLVAPEFQLHSEVSTTGYLNTLTWSINATFGDAGDLKPDYSIILPLATDPTALVNWLNLHLTANQLSANTVSLIKASISKIVLTATSTDADKLNVIYGAVLLVMACPEYIIQK